MEYPNFYSMVRKQLMKYKISVIIPFYDSYDSIDLLMSCLKNQTLLPNEVIIINSDRKKIIFKNKYPFQVIEKKVKLSYPGKARNFGINLAKNDYIAFIDCKTFPKNNWLNSYLNELNVNNSDVILATRYTLSTNKFSEYLKYLTYGNNKILSLAGTIGKKEKIKKNLFNSEIRAGEDLIWINNIKKNFKFTQSQNQLIVYNNLPEKFLKTIKKWFVYSQHNSIIDGFSEFQRLNYIYLIIFIILINYFYIYNFEKSTINIYDFNIILFLIYFIFRSIIRPVFLTKMPIKFLFPINWILIGSIGLTLDIVKTPGIFLGFSRTLFNKIKYLIKIK